MKPKFDVKKAHNILRMNDLGGYTIPTQGLYPFQWNWDAAITALGWFEMGEEARAWLELEMLLKGQWDNGMVPHIIFHEESDTYFPGPEVWGVKNAVKTSAISQPPVLATVVRILAEQAKDKALAEQKLAELLPRVIDYHLWWYRERDPENTGLVCSYHPWESGMDNSPQWDKPLAAVPAVDWGYVRRDTGHVDSKERPHKFEYDRYMYLVDFYKRSHFDSNVIYQHCPYKVQDIGIIAILHRATADLLAIGEGRVDAEAIQSLQASLKRTEAAIGSLWSEELSCFVSRDILTGDMLSVVTSAGMMPLLGRLANADQAKAMAGLLEDWLGKTAYGLSSTHPDSEKYEPQRYWRGPVWLHINWLIALGLEAYQMTDLYARLKQTSRDAVETAGFWEYFNAETGAGCGGDDFSWTAAVALYWLQD
jgi:glycogen debranching enzyme